MNNENKNLNEDFNLDEVTIEMLTRVGSVGYELYKKVKIRLVKRGFIMGLLTALAFQSLATIVVLLIMM